MSTPTSDAAPGALGDLPDEFKGFERIFEAEIRPRLVEQEARRRDATARALKFTAGGLGVGGLGALIGLSVFDAPPVAVASGLAAAGALALGWAPFGKLRSDAKRIIVEPVARALEVSFDPKPPSPPTIRRARDLHLVPSWDRAKYEDLITGARRGVDFEFFEAHLEEKRTTRSSNGGTRTRWVTVFKGQCVRFDFHKRFYGRTLVSRDAGFFNRFSGKRGMDRARLEDPTFEKAFEVYTTDQVESRYLLTPDFMQRLVDLEQAFKGKKLRCAFADGDMLLCVEGDDLFEPGSMFKRLDDPERMRRLLSDFATLYGLLDAVMEGRARETAERGEPLDQGEI